MTTEARRRIRFNRSQPTRSWPVRAASLLLLLEAIGLVAIHVLNLSRLDWSFVSPDEIVTLDIIPNANLIAISTALIFLPSAVLALLSAIGLFFIWRAGWLLAMLTQGLTLLVCLSLHFQLKPDIIYPIMLYSILMVLNLNSFEVRATVHNRQNLRRNHNLEPGTDEY